MGSHVDNAPAAQPGRRPLRPLVLLVLLVAAAGVCLWLVSPRSPLPPPPGDEPVGQRPFRPPPAGAEGAGEADFSQLRREMVERQLAGRDITDRRVLAAMRRIPRHAFVPDQLRTLAYADRPLPIGHQQTISQPYIVALMTQLARTRPDARALDIGTGSGYQAAVLAELVQRVYSIEIVCPLADSARQRLQSLGYANVEVICGDGYRGLPDQAPFDVIIVAAAPDHVPQPLVQQLAVGGRLVIPVGRFFQDLRVLEKRADGTVREESVAPVLFVPMTGVAEGE